MAWLLLALLLTACAPKFIRPDVAPSQHEIDLAECRQRQEMVGPMPTGPYGGLILAFGQINWIARRNQVLADCMTTKGYITE